MSITCDGMISVRNNIIQPNCNHKYQFSKLRKNCVIRLSSWYFSFYWVGGCKSSESCFKCHVEFTWQFSLQTLDYKQFYSRLLMWGWYMCNDESFKFHCFERILSWIYFTVTQNGIFLHRICKINCIPTDQVQFFYLVLCFKWYMWLKTWGNHCE